MDKQLLKDLFGTGLNAAGSLIGMDNLIDPREIRTKGLRRVNSAIDNYVDPLMKQAGSAVLNLAGGSAGIPGVGSALYGATGAIDGVTTQLTQPNTNVSGRLDIDPRMRNLANGGQVYENPMGDYGTDTIPVDSNGIPSSISGRPTVAMTDAGEVVWNGYVFSEDLGFAKKARSINKRFKFRDNDELSMAQRDREFANLADEQELYKYNNGLEADSEGYASGGKIHISPSKRGTFTAAASRHGMGVQEFASRVLSNKDNYSSAMVKKANFARNASKWHHAEGGMIEPHISYMPGEHGMIGFAGGGDFNLYLNKLNESNQNGVNDTVGSVTSSFFDNADINNYLDNSYNDFFSTQQPIDSATKPMKPGFQMGPDEWALLANLGTAAARGINALSTKETARPRTYNPYLVDFTNERHAAETSANTMRRMYGNRFRNNRAAAIAAMTGVDEQTAKILADSWSRQSQINSGALNQAGQFNAQAMGRADEINAQERGASASMIDRMITDTGAGIAGYYTDKQKRALDASMLQMIEQGKHYKWTKDANGNIVGTVIG